MNKLGSGRFAALVVISLLNTSVLADGIASQPGPERTAQAAGGVQPGGQDAQPMGDRGTAAPSGAQGEKAATREQTTGKGKAAGTIVYMLVPVQIAERGEAMKGGCWARFYDAANYGGDTLTLAGPVDMPNMTGPFGINWKDKISSVQTGAKARVLVYDNENFKDLVATFKPGQQTPDVSKKLGFFDEFSSLRIVCDGA